MRLATIRAGGTRLWGSDVPGGFAALWPEFPQGPGPKQAIEAGALPQVARAAEGRAPMHLDGSFAWDLSVPDPEKILCFGVNYPDRNAEYRDGSDAPAFMVLFPASRAAS